MMSNDNYQRLIRLAEETFSMRTDPEQLQVDESVIRQLKEIHPFTMNESRDEQGPVAWLLVIPTSLELMDKFISGEINEGQLFEMTMPGKVYEALYFCSALVLEEHQRQGIASRLAIEAIQEIRKEHPLKALFVWALSEGGDRASELVAEKTGLKLYKRAKV